MASYRTLEKRRSILALIAGTLLVTSATSITNVASTTTGCTPYVETLNFYDANMDGKWIYDDSDGHYRLNISGSTAYYTMYYELIEGTTGYWDVYLIDGDGLSSDYLTYCEQTDITYCAGNWMVFDDDVETWVFDPDATSLYTDCSYTDCDFTGFNESDTNCYVPCLL